VDVRLERLAALSGPVLGGLRREVGEPLLDPGHVLEYDLVLPRRELELGAFGRHRDLTDHQVPGIEVRPGHDVSSLAS
jgi:hypothetical protein